MDSTYWAILLGSAGVGMGIAAALTHLAAGRRALTAGLAVGAALLVVVGYGLGGPSPAVAGADAKPDLVVGVQTRMYEFQVAYPVGPPAIGELVLPAGRTTRIDLSAVDVVHGFWLPELGVRAPVVPGTPSSVLIRPPAPGEHRLLCGEFCGPEHVTMRGVLKVLPPAEFEAWLSARRGDG